MATVQFGTDRGDRLEQVTEATGGGAPTKDFELNIKTGMRKDQVILALDLFKLTVMESKVFTQ